MDKDRTICTSIRVCADVGCLCGWDNEELRAVCNKHPSAYGRYHIRQCKLEAQCPCSCTHTYMVNYLMQYIAQWPPCQDDVMYGQCCTRTTEDEHSAAAVGDRCSPCRSSCMTTDTVKRMHTLHTTQKASDCSTIQLHVDRLVNLCQLQAKLTKQDGNKSKHSPAQRWGFAATSDLLSPPFKFPGLCKQSATYNDNACSAQCRTAFTYHNLYIHMA